MLTTTGLPSVDELIRMNPYDRAIMEAKVLAELKRRKRQNIEASLALPDIADWIEAKCWDADKCSVNGSHVNYSKSYKIRLTDTQKRILRHVFRINPKTGRFPYRTIVKSKPKKQGKSGEAGFITSWFAENVEAPNNIHVIAKDREQSSGRVFRSALPTLLDIGGKREGKYGIWLPNGTFVSALTSDPEKEAGGNYGLTVWDELWAFKSEREKLLWDEMKPVKTRMNSIRLIVTYAGFIDTSDLLWNLYSSIFKTADEDEIIEGARPVPELEDIRTTSPKGVDIPVCWENPAKGLFYENDHNQRAIWEFEDETIDALSSDVAYYRHKYNYWTASENPMLEPTVLASSFDGSANVRQSKKQTFAIDAGWKKACSGIVGSYVEDFRYKTGYAQAWYPVSASDPLDLGVIKDEILRLWKAGLIHRREPLPKEKKIVEREGLICIDVWYDPTQLHDIAMRLRKGYKLLMAEFDQNLLRLRADTFLKQQYEAFNIDNLASDELKSHLEAAKAQHQTNSKESLIRIVAGEGMNAKPVDLAVAQSMSIYQASKRPKAVPLAGGISVGAKGWE